MAATIKIRVLESVASTHYDYGSGFEGDVPEEIAKDLLKAGLAELIGGSKTAANPHQTAEKATSTAAKKSEKRT